jgi:hypothetical protein
MATGCVDFFGVRDNSELGLSVRLGRAEQRVHVWQLVE